MRFDLLKKTVVLMVAAGSVSLVSLSNLNAQSSGPTPVVEQPGPLLNSTQSILSDTVNIMNSTSGISNSLTTASASNPGVLYVLDEIYTLMQNASWGMPENDSGLNPNVINDIVTLGQLVAQNSMSAMNQNSGMFQTINQQQINASQITSANTPNFDDLTFSSVLGLPFWTGNNDPENGQNHAQNWIMNASGLNITHVLPSSSWQGSSSAVQTYQNYFNAAMAVASFNAYALSTLANDNTLASAEYTVMNDVSNWNNWIKTVEGENIGWVLRQLLIFQSIAVIYLIHMAQVSENILVASTLTNTLILSANQQWEAQMVAKAQGGAASTQGSPG